MSLFNKSGEIITGPSSDKLLKLDLLKEATLIDQAIGKIGILKYSSEGGAEGQPCCRVGDLLSRLRSLAACLPCMKAAVSVGRLFAVREGLFLQAVQVMLRESRGMISVLVPELTEAFKSWKSKVTDRVKCMADGCAASVEKTRSDMEAALIDLKPILNDLSNDKLDELIDHEGHAKLMITLKECGGDGAGGLKRFD